MRFYLLLLVFTYSFSGNSQEIKKKYFGTYAGEIPSYALQLGEEVFEVQAAPIEVQLKPEGILLEKIASNEINGTYQFIKEDKNRIYFEVKLEGQFIPESYVLYKKDKRLERKGIYPQPDVFLRKI
ncbi:MAG: hypothetical protein K0S23_1980 [Fluviicola sp.]|jgi:hypothetical protein|uniref:hypothetical protein n=1 Tax=Fluviicola sp. TaxID=1917219 RepID=UPI00260632FB|nr:hypothetical protein [Fluviicola sp.]MDF3027673.1 hypothetical protein [Fluviicola sp.]